MSVRPVDPARDRANPAYSEWNQRVDAVAKPVPVVFIFGDPDGLAEVAGSDQFQMLLRERWIGLAAYYHYETTLRGPGVLCFGVEEKLGIVEFVERPAIQGIRNITFDISVQLSKIFDDPRTDVSRSIIGLIAGCPAVLNSSPNPARAAELLELYGIPSPV